MSGPMVLNEEMRRRVAMPTPAHCQSALDAAFAAPRYTYPAKNQLLDVHVEGVTDIDIIAVTVGSSRTYSPTRVPLCN